MKSRIVAVFAAFALAGAAAWAAGPNQSMQGGSPQSDAPQGTMSMHDAAGQGQQMSMQQRFDRMQQMMQQARTMQNQQKRMALMQEHMQMMMTQMHSMMGGMQQMGMQGRGGMMGGSSGTNSQLEQMQNQMQFMMQMMNQMLQQQQLMMRPPPKQ